MGVSYRPIFGVGLEFECQYEVEDFLRTAGYENTEESEEEYGFEESFRELPTEFSIQCLNYYSGNGYVVYIPVSLNDVNKVGDSVNQVISLWKTFLKQEPEIIHTCVVS